MNAFDSMRQGVRDKQAQKPQPFTPAQQTAQQTAVNQFGMQTAPATTATKAQQNSMLQSSFASIDRLEASFNRMNGR